jgi:Xaa-Pro aminopeptidase
VIEDRVLRGGHYAAELEAPEVYRRRRRAVQAGLVGGAVAVLLGTGDERASGDLGSFRQDPGFFYLTGVEIPNAALLLQADREALFLPARRPHLEAWTGPKLGPGEEAATMLGLERVLDRDRSEVVRDARRRPVAGFFGRLAEALASGGELWLPLPAPQESGEPTPELRLVQVLRDRLPSFELRDLSPVLSGMRVRKEEGEISLLRKAVAATAAGVRAAARAARPGASEASLDGAAFAAIRAAGAEGWSFPPIIGSGTAGCVLHYDANRGVLADGELVVVDIGARWGYYCGDLTRTLPVNGRFDARQRDLYLAVLEAYRAAVSKLHPGARIADARKAAFTSLEASPVRSASNETLGQFFIHGLGHFLGLEAHDVGGEEAELLPGMVITVEPGIYLGQEGVGIRIEDDYLITEGDAECLSADLPRQPEEVEALLQGESGRISE